MTTTEAVPKQRRIGPQPGPQTMFLATAADIAIYGGAAGGGKSYGLLLDPVRHINVPGFGAVIFRRTMKQIKNEGGLWDESMKLYPFAGADPKSSEAWWEFPSSNAVSFNHLEHEKNILDHQGAQYPMIGFDELTHFTAAMFWYLLSRNRSTCGVKPYVRATCNPDADSWVAELISWWIDQDTGYPIPERSGVLRWFVRDGETLVWGDSFAELKARYPKKKPKSLTFIAAKLEDNLAMAEADPDYEANLDALPSVERERLRHGNWKIRPSGGMFKREWFKIVDALPGDLGQPARCYDLAATEDAPGKDPDYTAGIKGARSLGNSGFYVTDVARGRWSPHTVEANLVNIASQDGRACRIRIPQDPGSAGKSQAATLIKLLAGYDVKATPPTGDKTVRARPAAAQAEAGNVYLLRGPWNEAFIAEACAFPLAGHDDQVDAFSDLISELALGFGPAVVTRVRM